MEDWRTNECSCRRKNGKGKSIKPGKRKRQTLVHNPEEELWHEPYMNCLRKEFSQISMLCDSKIELPWKDIALPAVAKKIRANVVMKDNAADEEAALQESPETEKGLKVEPKESSGKMNLPWNDLLVMDTVVPRQTLGANGAPCDSTLEIPWDDLALEKPIQISPIPEEEPCGYDDVEIPWDEILVPADCTLNRKVDMTDRDGRSNDSKTCHTSVFTPESSPGQHPRPSSLTSVTLHETNPPTIANTDSEGDYETSSEGPHSPRPEFRRSGTTFLASFDGDIIPESNESLLVSTSLFPGGYSSKENDPSASYTIIGTAASPRIDVTSKNSACAGGIESASSCSKILSPLSCLDGFEARRTEYFVAPRIETDANKSESLPVITIATPWGSYEYPDVHMPAERLVSDSQVDIKEKMRLIAACMDGSHLAASRAKFFDEPKQFLYRHDVRSDEIKPRDVEFAEAELKVESNRVYCSRPTTPRTPKIITVTSPKIFSEAFNVLPIIRNPDLGSDYTFPPSPSGSSLPVTMNNTAMSMTSSFYLHRDGESPRNITAKKSSFDPLSRIEGELAPLQNELSEIRGKVRALNLDYNLSCIEGRSKIPNAMNWIRAENHSNNARIRLVKDEFLRNDYLYPSQDQNVAYNVTNTIGVSNFWGDNQPRYRYPFANRSFVPSDHSYDLERVENQFKEEEVIAEKSVSHPDASVARIFNSENCEPEIEEISVESPRGTDRNLSPVYICTSTPSSLSSKKNVASTESKKETDSCEEKTTTSPEIRLPDFLDKICIVPISYVGGMPDPPAEPVFSFEQEEEPGFRISHKVLRIEHPDAPKRRRADSAEISSSLSDTVLTFDSEIEDSLSAKKEEDNSSIENSLRPSDRMLVSKFARRNSSSNVSASTDGKEETRGRTYIRGLISGPEDFL